MPTIIEDIDYLSNNEKTASRIPLGLQGSLIGSISNLVVSLPCFFHRKLRDCGVLQRLDALSSLLPLNTSQGRRLKLAVVSGL